MPYAPKYVFVFLRSVLRLGISEFIYECYWVLYRKSYLSIVNILLYFDNVTKNDETIQKKLFFSKLLHCCLLPWELGRQ